MCLMKEVEQFISCSAWRMKRTWFEGFLVQSVQHVEEVLDVAQVLARQVVLSSDSVSVGVGCDGWCYSHKSIDLLISEHFIFVDILSGQGGVGFWFLGRV